MAFSIPDDKIAEIRDRTDIVNVVSQYVKLRRTGRNFIGLCPFHAEKTPSFTVSPDKQFFHCFGCNEGGSVFQFLMKLDGKSFPEAVRELADKAGVSLPEREEPAARSAAREERERLLEVIEKACCFFQDLLLRDEEGKPALQYLQSRGISLDSIKTFRLGYGGKGWDRFVSHCRSRGISLRDAEEAGLVLKGQSGSFYDRFRQRVIFPISDATGKVRGFGGRIFDGQAEGAKYVNSPESKVYDKGSLLYGLSCAKEAARKQGFAVVVEGYIDCVSTFQAGMKNVVAPCGTSLTPGQVLLISRYCPEMVAAFDGDEAGEKASARLLETVVRTGVRARVAVMDHGFDPDSLVREKGIGRLEEIISGARPVIEYAIGRAVGPRHPETVDARMRALERLREIFEKIPEGMERDLYVRSLSKEFSIEERQILDFFGRAREETPAQARQERKTPSVEEQLIALLLENDNFIEEFVKRDGERLLGDERLRAFSRKIVKIFETRGCVKAADVLDDAGDAGLRERLSKLMLESEMDAQTAAATFSNYMRRIEMDRLKDRNARLQDELRALSARGETRKQAEVQKELMEVQKRLLGVKGAAPSIDIRRER